MYNDIALAKMGRQMDTQAARCTDKSYTVQVFSVGCKFQCGMQMYWYNVRL